MTDNVAMLTAGVRSFMLPGMARKRKVKRIALRITEIDGKWLQDQADEIDGTVSDILRRLIREERQRQEIKK